MKRRVIPAVPWSIASIDQLNEANAGLPAELAQVVRLERLNEYRRVAVVPPVRGERRQQSIFERQADAAEIARMLRFRIDADRPATFATKLLRECEDVVERRQEHTSELQSHSDLVCR